MTSIYEKVLGEEFSKLHPQIQKRFGFGSENQIASIGKGVMEHVWYGKWYTLPFLALGTWRNILFPQGGKHIPFSIENYAYKDSFGRETVTWIRTYQFPDRVRRFDATMIYSEKRRKIVDYLGTYQHLAVEIDMFVAENGGMGLRSGKQFFYEGILGFRFPMTFSGYADVCEWYDDEKGEFQIDVQVKNKLFGPLFGYRGSFDIEYIPIAKHDIPQHVKPVREERRE